MDLDIKTIASSGVAVVMAIAAGVQQFRVQDLDADLGSVQSARDKAMAILKETRDGVEANAKRADNTIVDLQSQVDKATNERSRLEKDNASLLGRLEAAQANTQRMADLAEKLCKKPTH